MVNKGKLFEFVIDEFMSLIKRDTSFQEKIKMIGQKVDYSSSVNQVF